MIYINPNPQPPQLYSLIKLHKTGYPIRPVVSYIPAPTYKISKFLINTITKYCNFKSTTSINNSFELVDKIKNFNLPSNAKLISFDVVNLFPSVPPSETIELVKNLLNLNNVNVVIQNEIITLLETCLHQNYFSFDGKYYFSNEGLIMGNPLSPLLAEIFMNNIEKMIFKHPLTNKILYWYRYVDDILVCFIGTTRQLNVLETFINSIHSNIKFTLEIEKDNSINFLDLTITRTNNKHGFSIFHKPSHTDTTIHNSSVHPYQYKMAAYNSMIHRLLNIPMSESDYKKEISLIKQIATNNNYNPDIIDKIIQKKKYKKAISLVYPLQKDYKQFNSVTYIGEPSKKLKKLLSKFNCNVAYKTNNNLSKYIKNNKQKVIKDQKPGVYKLNCNNCNKFYIGKTTRNFKLRISEHKRSFKYKKQDSNYAKHLNNENHTFNEDFEILQVESNYLKLGFLEAVEINKHKLSNNLLNDQLDLNYSPLLNLFTNKTCITN